MPVRAVHRRRKRHLVLDFYYRKPDGSLGRYRKDAEVQTMAAARAEERRRLAAFFSTGSPEQRPLGCPDGRALTPEAATATAPSFADVVKGYLETYAPSRLKPSTMHCYRSVLDSTLVPRFGSVAVDQIDTTLVRKLDVELVAAQCKPATRRNIQTVLRSVLCRYAVEVGLLESSPRQPALPRVGRTIIASMSEDELDRVLARSCFAHRRAFLLAAHAGLRSGEIRALRWADVDLKVGQLVVRANFCRGVLSTPKSGHERVVPLTDALKSNLAKTESRPRRGLVASNARGGAWTEFSLRLALHRACARAGLDPYRFHDLRHCFVTSLFRAGVSAPTVQALAGHAELTTTQGYAHVGVGDLAEAIRRLSSRQQVGNKEETEVTSPRQDPENMKK